MRKLFAFLILLLIGPGLFVSNSQAQGAGDLPYPQVLVDDDFSGSFFNLALWQTPSRAGFPHPELDGEGSVGFFSHLDDSVRTVNLTSTQAFRLPSGHLEMRIKGLPLQTGTFGVYLTPASDAEASNGLTLIEFVQDSTEVLATDSGKTGEAQEPDSVLLAKKGDFRQVTVTWGEGRLHTSGVGKSTIRQFEPGESLWHLVLKGTHEFAGPTDIPVILVDYLRLRK